MDPEAHYRLARERLGLSEDEDAAAATLLSRLLVDRFVLSPERLRARFEDATVVVLGAGPADVAALARASRRLPVVVAGSAVGPAREHGLEAALVVSDLDGSSEAHLAYSDEGVPLVVHAHGDNTTLLRELVPQLQGPLVGTSQTAPPVRPVPLHRWGGFTDGDRAIFVAETLGAKRVLLAGCSFWTGTQRTQRGVEGAEGSRKGVKLGIARELVGEVGVPVGLW